MRRFMIVVGGLVALLVLGALLVPEGEIVMLVTRDAGGGERETQLWLVEIDDALYLRAGNPKATWLTRLRADSRVELARRAYGTNAHGGFERRHFVAHAIDDPALRARVADEMARKYGLADRLWSLFTDHAGSVAIRLDALPAAPGAQS